MHKELAPGVFEYLFPEDLAKDCVKYLEKISYDEWQDSLVGGGRTALSIRSSEGYNIDNVQSLSGKIRESFYGCVKDYVKHFDTSVLQDEGLNVLKYEGADNYTYHVDASWNMYRTISALIYLNPNKYEGGHTHFKYFDLYIKPEKPSIVLFPSNYLYLHSAKPVTKGRKYVIVTWLNDKPIELINSNHGSGCACSR
jgi:predicted 2-oxoglutarate/Fe(II)-dependent dioxygenase YbiX